MGCQPVLKTGHRLTACCLGKKPSTPIRYGQRTKTKSWHSNKQNAELKLKYLEGEHHEQTMANMCVCVLGSAGYGQLIVKNSSDIQLMKVDTDANVVIGTSGQVGSLINMGDATVQGQMGIGGEPYGIPSYEPTQLSIETKVSGQFEGYEQTRGLSIRTNPRADMFTGNGRVIGLFNSSLLQDEASGLVLDELNSAQIQYGSRFNSDGGIINKATGLTIVPYQQGAGAITTMIDLRITPVAMQDDQNIGKHWGIYINHDADNYFGGDLGLGQHPVPGTQLTVRNEIGEMMEGKEEVRGLAVLTYPNEYSTANMKRVLGIWNNVLAASEADNDLDRLTGTHIQYGTHTGSSGSIDKAIGINIAPYQNGGANVTTMIDLYLTNDVIGTDPENPPAKHWGIRIEHAADNYFHGALGLGREPDSDQYKLDVAGVIRCDNVSTTSDARFKKDITPLYNTLDKITQLNGVEYLWRTEEYPNHQFSEDKQVGLIAQEVEHIIPEVVDQDAEGYRSIAYDALTPYLIEAIKEQQEEIELLRQQVKALQEK